MARSRFRDFNRESGEVKPSAPSALLQGGTFIQGAGDMGAALRIDTPMAQRLVANPALEKTFSQKLTLAAENMVRELRELGAVLILGSAIAATVQVAAPRELILGLGQGMVSSICGHDGASCCGFYLLNGRFLFRAILCLYVYNGFAAGLFNLWADD